MKKYELTQNTKITLRGTLYQIKALIDIPQKGVKIGDLGGYIQHEDNLSHEGTCWVDEKAYVFDNAKVLGDAQVFGDAWVFDNAQIYAMALVYGEARVFGTARVFNNAWVYGNAKVYGDTRIFDDARIFGKAYVYGNAYVYGKAKVSCDAALIGGRWTENPITIIGSLHNVCQCDTNKIKIGCHVLTFDEWLEEYERIGKLNKYTDKQIKEYKMFIKLIIKLNKTT